MAARKHLDALCVGITVFTLVLTILFMNGEALGIQAVASEENSDALFTENDLNAQWDAADATRITLSDGGSTVHGNGAYVQGESVHIVYGGKYVLSGALSDGSVVVEADGDDKIWLLFSGVSLHCADGPALRVEQVGKVFLTLQADTENTLSSGSAYSEEAISAGYDGTLYAKDDLTVNGTGSLQITAEGQHGIVCNDDLTVTGGTLRVTAAQDAVHVNDSVRIREADLTLSAGDDGIAVSNDAGTSFLYVESGSIAIPACREGLEAVQITIAGGTVDIAATDDGLNASGSSENAAINLTGGTVTVTVENGRDADGLDSNRDITISGGTLFVSVSDQGGSCAIDYGSENGGTCLISGGTVLACGSSGMAEGFDASSPQGFLMQTTSAAAGTTVTVRDADGNELLSRQVPCSFSSVLVSTPDMHVGDTCTLTVGDTETEVTLDNASNGGGFGGFGGGRMLGGNGFGRGQRPEGTQTGDAALPDAENGDAPAGFPGKGAAGSAQPPELPEGMDPKGTPPETAPGGTEEGLPPDPTQEDPTEPSENEPPSDGDQPGALPREGSWADRRGGAMQGPMGDLGQPENTADPTDAGTPVTAAQLLLLGVSALVLLAGCGIAAGYHRRG